MPQPLDILDEAQERYGKYFCRRCLERGAVEEGWTRRSFGVYAATVCDACWASHELNHDDDGKTFDPLDAGESMEEP